MPLAAIAAACHVSFWFCILSPFQVLRCFAPGETVFGYKVPTHVGLYLGPLRNR